MWLQGREQEQEAREALENTLETLLEIEPESLVREDELGTAFSFKDGLPVFRRTLDLFEEIETNLTESHVEPGIVPQNFP